MTVATERLASRFKALADPMRMRLVAVCAQGEASVSELTDILGQSQPRVSQQLKVLCDAGLLTRFRDGHFVFYRLPTRTPASELDMLLELLPLDDDLFARDMDRLRKLRAAGRTERTEDDRPLQRALIALSVTAPLGDLLDIGSGQGKLLKLLASRSKRAVGVDIDADQRRFARAELLLAGLPNCTLRKADMYALPFAGGSFDTVILDDVLRDAERPVAALVEALRLVRRGGRLVVLTALPDADASDAATRLATWCAEAGLRLAPPRAIPVRKPRWLLAVATPYEQTIAA